MRRIAQPEEVANAALFQISDEASFVNGVALAVDGGATALKNGPGKITVRRCQSPLSVLLGQDQ